MLRKLLIALGCIGCTTPPAQSGASGPVPVSDPVPLPVPLPLPDPVPVAAPAASPETTLGLPDTGIWSDLDDRITLSLPPHLTPSRASATLSAAGTVLVLSVDGFPAKAYPVVSTDPLTLRPGDAAELAPLVDLANVPRADGAHDRDGDGIPDSLDVLLGAKKAAAEGGPYGGDYISLAYPGGDVPRHQGVCTDVVIRSFRNAGVDLQVAVHQDIAKSKKSYPMVKGKGDVNIDHRRVKTILPWFKRHAEAHTADLDDPDDPYRPGDVVFLDTFPEKPGPDHVGVVTDEIGESGHLLVINAWTDGYVTQPMDLLGWVPVTHRYRL